MGKFDFEIPADFIKQLGNMADIDRIAPQMIDEAMPILAENMKKGLASHRRTGDMIKSVKYTKATQNKYGYYAAVRPTGKDRKGVQNMEKLVYLEYGTSKQPATPVMAKIINDSRSAVLAKMQEVFNREVGK